MHDIKFIGWHPVNVPKEYIMKELRMLLTLAHQVGVHTPDDMLNSAKSALYTAILEACERMPSSVFASAVIHAHGARGNYNTISDILALSDWDLCRSVPTSLGLRSAEEARALLREALTTPPDEWWLENGFAIAQIIKGTRLC
jgi:hypothetical protein